MSERPSQKPLSADEAAQARVASNIGRVISQRYRIDEVIAMGGMGAVYRGEHVRMHKRVAIKILHPDAEQLPELVRRFEREAIAGAHVQHPNVATATDFGEDEDGSFFLVLEYVRGTTLHALIRQGPMSVPRAVHIARQLAAGLGAAHAMNIVHRDVKPRNVMVIEPQDDLVKLIDFGLAKVNVDRLRVETESPESQRADRSPYVERLTTAGSIFGTIAYLAPESAYGMELVDARSDLYAVGLILYEMLAGKHPFLAVDPIELFNQQRSALVPPIAEHAPGIEVPAAVEAVVRRLLEKYPDARYESAEALIAALDEAVAPLGLSHEPAPVSNPPRSGSTPSASNPPRAGSTPSASNPPRAGSTPRMSSTPELTLAGSSLMLIDELTDDAPTQVRSSSELLGDAAVSARESARPTRRASTRESTRPTRRASTPLDTRRTPPTPEETEATELVRPHEILAGRMDELRADLEQGGSVAPSPASAAGGGAADARVLEPRVSASGPDQMGSTPVLVPLALEPPPPESIPLSFGSRPAMAPISMQELIAEDAVQRAAEQASAESSRRAPAHAEQRASRMSFAPMGARVGRIAVALGAGVIVAGILVAITGRRRAPPEPDDRSTVLATSASAPATPSPDPAAAPADSAVAPVDSAAAPPDSAAPAAPADSATAPPDSAAPAAPPDEAARQALLDAAKARHWVEAGDAITALAARDPAALDDRRVAVAARDAAIAIAKTGGEHADKVFDALANRFGAKGIDVLYEIVEVRGRSTPAVRATELLRQPEVIARGTPAARIAFQLRDCTCGEKMGFLDRAVADGDERTLVVLQTVVRPCFKKNRAVDEAIRTMRTRFPEP